MKSPDTGVLTLRLRQWRLLRSREAFYATWQMATGSEPNSLHRLGFWFDRLFSAAHVLRSWSLTSSSNDNILVENFVELLRANRLCKISIHSCGEVSLLVALHGVSSQCDNGLMSFTSFFSLP